MLNIHHLRIFYMVAQLDSYSRAAERLDITQPAVSIQVKKLEEAIGLPLVVQRGRQIGLTDAGRTLASYAERIFRLTDEALQAMDDHRELRQGRLRLAASSTPGAYILPKVVAEFKRRFPGVEVSLQIGNTRTAERLVADGFADLAVIGDLPADGTDCDLTPLCADRLVLVVRPDDPLADTGRIGVAELPQIPLILREQGSSTREVLDSRMAAHGVTPKVAYELGSTDAVRESVLAGLGAAVLTYWAVEREVAAGRLTVIEVDDLDLSRTLHLCKPLGVATPQVVAGFLQLLSEMVNGR